MIKNYFKTAWRNILKHKLFSFISILGLAMGITASFLIYLYVSYELSYDAYHVKSDRIYRLTSDNNSSTGHNYSSTSFAIGSGLQRAYPGIEAVTRIWYRDFFVEKGVNKFQEDNVMYADSSLFSVFSFPFLNGNSQNALTDPFSVVLSQAASEKYFGKADPIGQTLSFKNDFDKYDARVTGVMNNILPNSTFRADIIISMTTLSKKLEPEIDNQWEAPIGNTYLLLRQGYGPEKIEAQLPAFIKNHLSKFVNTNAGNLQLALEPLKTLYLHGKYNSPETGNIYNLYIFSIIGIFVLLIAGINFVNLTTARSAERAKEAGILKAIGSTRNQLVTKFLGDSLILSLFGFLLSLLFCTLLIPSFNNLCGKIICRGIFNEPEKLFLMFGIAIATGFIAGLYPAFVISGFKPASVLRGQFTTGTKGVVLRKSLVVFQFIISTALIIGTIIVYQQLNYIRSQPLGFKKDQMVVIDFHHDNVVTKQLETIKQELTKLPDVLSVSASSGIPNAGFESADYNIENKNGVMEHLSIPLYMVDEDFFHQYQMRLLSGRAFSKDFVTDFKESLIVNEAAVTKLGYSSPSEIIGKRFSGEGSGTVIGVVKNFHFLSFHENITPLIFRTFLPANRYITVSIIAANMTKTVNTISNKWKQIAPDRPFDYFFLDEAIARQYTSEVNFGKLFLCFSGFTIFISCLGLYGLALFSTVQRKREIGIRKVLGANVTSIISLLSKDFIKLIITAFVIASPVAWFAMNKWLQGFAYRINISWWAFVLAGFISLGIALFTLSFHSIKAAIANPVKSLKTE